MSLEHAILGLLNEHPRSGYDLKTRCFDGPLSPLWSADQAQIYRTLDKLEKLKFVSSRRKRQTGRPDRRIYEITHHGRESLGEWLGTPVPLAPTRDPLLLQVYFGSTLGDEALLDVLASRRASHQERLEGLRSASASLARDDTMSDRSMTLRQTALDGAIARERATIDWLDDCIDAVTEGALPGSNSAGIGQRHLFAT
jgi:DNA-binding PadR family transcriptional regulator